MLQLVESVHDDDRWQAEFDVIWDCSRVTAHIVLPNDVGPLVDEASRQFEGRGVLIESQSVGGSLIAELLAIRLRFRGGTVTVCKTMPEALAALRLEALPVSMASLVEES